jgi:hypothetical protein
MNKFFFIAVSVMVFAAVIIGCKKTNSIPFSALDIKGSPVATNTPGAIAKTPLLDDLSGCTNQNLWGGYWYTFNDSESCPGGAGTCGTSVVWPEKGGTFEASMPGHAGAGDCAARITGTVTKLSAPNFEYGLVAMGVQVDPLSGAPDYKSIDISAYETSGYITFWARGDGKQYAVKVKADPTVLVGDAAYEYVFTAPAAWTQVTVYFGGAGSPKFAQPGWAPPANVIPIAQVLAKVTDIQFQTVGQPLTSIDLWIDEISFENCGF